LVSNEGGNVRSAPSKRTPRYTLQIKSERFLDTAKRTTEREGKERGTTHVKWQAHGVLREV